MMRRTCRHRRRVTVEGGTVVVMVAAVVIVGGVIVVVIIVGDTASNANCFGIPHLGFATTHISRVVDCNATISR